MHDIVPYGSIMGYKISLSDWIPVCKGRSLYICHFFRFIVFNSLFASVQELMILMQVKREAYASVVTSMNVNADVFTVTAWFETGESWEKTPLQKTTFL